MEKIEIGTEGKSYNLVARTFEEIHGITGVMITFNEEKYIVKALEELKPLVKRIVLIDGGSNDRTVELATPLVDFLEVIPFDCHFGKQKNNALRHCYTDWVLFMDPDEILSDKLKKKIPSLIEQDEIDCYAFPRREYIDGKEDEEIYPDYQDRLFRAYCRFVRPIHEEVVGYKNKKELELGIGIDILHKKEAKRHAGRNRAYPFYEMHYANETGGPGEQTKKTFKDKYKDITSE